MVQRMTMAWVKWLGCAGLLLLLSGPVMAAEGVLEILAAGDVLLGGRMLEAPQAGELFGPLTRQRLEQDPLPRVIADYIAGMTDTFALKEYKRYHS